MALLLNANDTVSRSYSYTIPSPNHVSEVQAVGDRTGNLFKAPKYTSKTENGVTWESNGDGTITVSGIASGYSTFKLANAYQIPSDCVGQKLTFNYRIGKVSNIVWDSIVFFDENNTEVSRYSMGNSGAVTIEIESNFKKVNACVKRNNNYEVSGTVGLMINSGSTPIPYEPYGYKIPVVTSADGAEPITTPIYLPTPLYRGEVMRSDGTITRSDGTTETFTAPQIPTINGTTVIDVDTAVKPTEMYVKCKSSK